MFHKPYLNWWILQGPLETTERPADVDNTPCDVELDVELSLIRRTELLNQTVDKISQDGAMKVNNWNLHQCSIKMVNGLNLSFIKFRGLQSTSHYIHTLVVISYWIVATAAPAL